MTTSNSYWSSREATECEWIKQNLKTDADFNKQLQGYLDKALRNIQRDIDSELSRYAEYSNKSLAGAKQAVSKEDIKAYEATAKEIVELARKLEKQLGRDLTYSDFSQQVNDRLKLYNATMRINRLEMLKSQIGQELVNANLQVNSDMIKKLSKDYQDELIRQAGILRVDQLKVDSKAIAKIIMARQGDYTFSDRIWINQDILKSKLDSLLINATIQGKSPIAIARQLRDQVSKTVANQGYVTERIARTESARVQTQAQLDSFDKYGYDHVKWVAEPSACQFCQEIADGGANNDGVYSTHLVPDIPVHPNCRCSISAYVFDEDSKDNDKVIGTTDDKEIEYGFSDDEIYAVRNYTGAKSYFLNEKMRNGEELNNDDEIMVNNLKTALDKVPKYTSTKPLNRSYNFRDDDVRAAFAEKVIKTKVFDPRQFISASKKVYDPNDNLRMIIYGSKSGCDISELNRKELEVLFKPGVKFKVIGYSTDNQSRIYIGLEEIL